MGSLSTAETTLFTYDFTKGDIGEIFNISLYLETSVVGGGSIAFSEDDTLVFDSDFYDTLKIDTISGGIEAVEGPPIPIPGAVWLMGSGLIAMVGIRRRKKG